MFPVSTISLYAKMISVFKYSVPTSFQPTSDTQNRLDPIQQSDQKCKQKDNNDIKDKDNNNNQQTNNDKPESKDSSDKKKINDCDINENHEHDFDVFDVEININNGEEERLGNDAFKQQ